MPQTKQQNILETQAVHWRLELLHVTQTQVLLNGQVLETLDRRSALLFAYLALEGSTPRSKMAGLLYPNNTDDTARANLRQRLKRLRDTFGTDLIVPEDTLRLRPDLEVDAVQLESLAFTGEYEKAILFGGKLLPHLEPEDSPELSEWLDATRERLNLAWREALENEAERLEKTNLAQALELALRLLENDALSEEAHRRVMRLYYLQGDRSSALKTFERLKTTLANEMGIEPLAQTLELLRVIERGETTPQHAPKPIHVTLQRPPVLIGREHDWAQLEAAWTKGQMIVISGEAGAGKTRLALDFLAAKGEFARFDGRPGDALVSYSTHARTYRQMLQNHQLDLPEWVRLELSRILPELGTPPNPIQNEADKLRFYQAKAEATRLAVEAGMQNVFLDDLQFMDDASFESGFGIYLQNTQNASMHTILTCREAELSQLQLQTLKQAFDAGQAVQIKLSPLEQHEVQAMLESLGVSGLERFGQTMHQATGGNPMFVLETARDLVSGGNLEQAQTEALPLPKSVSAAIRNRLTKLEPAAMRLARVASVAATDFTLSLAANVLETHVLDLSDSVTELEKAQVLQGLTFTHDLIAQTTLEGLPLSIRNLLHDRIAVYLEKIEGNPARIAHHFLEAGMETRAVPFLILAAETSKNNYRYEDACHFFERAGNIDIQFQNQDRAFESLYRAIDIRIYFDLSERMPQLVEDLLNIAVTGEQKAKAYLVKAEFLKNLGHNQAVEENALKGIEALQGITNNQILAALNGALSSALWAQGRSLEAIPIQEMVIELTLMTGILEDIATSYANLASIYGDLQNFEKTIENYEKALDIRCQLPDEIAQAQTRINLATVLANIGLADKSLEQLELAYQTLQKSQGTTVQQIQCLTELGQRNQSLGRYSSALHHIQEAIDLATKMQFWALPVIQSHEVNVLLILGQLTQAQQKLRVIRATGQLRPIHLVGVIRQEIILRKCLQLETQDLIQEVNEIDVPEAVKFQALIEDLRSLAIKKQLGITAKYLQNAHDTGSFGREIVAQTKQAQVLLFSDPQAALTASARAVALYDAYKPIAFYRGETLYVHCCTLVANQHKDAKPFLQETLKWLLETANNHVSPEYHESFLTKNPHNAAILELAKNAGLEIS
jgi:DNA-binding SARP family transcriptional activator/replicative DNA helicase